LLTGSKPQNLCFRWIQFQPTRRHPVINGLDACRKSLNSQCFISGRA